MSKVNVDKGLIGNELIENKINKLREDFTDESLSEVLSIIRKRMIDNGQFVVGVDVASNNSPGMSLKTVKYNGAKWFIAYTSFDEELKGKGGVMSCFLADISQVLNITMKSDSIEGLILNPHGNILTLNKSVIEVIIGDVLMK